MSEEEMEWVRNAIRLMKKSETYRSNIIDEWYESLPVIRKEDCHIVIVIFFGQNASSSGGGEKTERLPLMPHICCIIRYPEMKIQWRTLQRDNTGEFLPQSHEALRSGPSDPMKARRAYYTELSRLLLAGSMMKTKELVTRLDCELAQSVDRHMKAAANPLLDSLYDIIGRSLTDWIAMNCSLR